MLYSNAVTYFGCVYTYELVYGIGGWSIHKFSMAASGRFRHTNGFLLILLP